ncbi:MAG: DNA polymerase III subunit gamma/tau, partial [Kiritimatiellota bacterium]|nr:DNA polymerase III subunit gamma/tau [Kiritimatiellota bacterium]
MAYEVLARKWRPKQFQDVVGQDHVIQTLTNAIRMNRVAHAYLFVGPRGIGKTSIARIFAKALNCKDGMTPTP